MLRDLQLGKPLQEYTINSLEQLNLYRAELLDSARMALGVDVQMLYFLLYR